MHAACTDQPVALQIGAPLLRDPAITLAFMATSEGDPGCLHPEEAAALSSEAVMSRRREFAAGRACAARLIAGRGLPPTPIAVASDRSPVWPGGVVGSISHSRTLAGAALALCDSGIVSIGLDIEELEPLPDELIEDICVDSERAWLASHAAAHPHNAGLLAKAIFSAKEAVYKCQYPLTHEMFGFEMIEIEIDLSEQRFLARFRDDVGPFMSGDQLAGALWLSGDHIISLVSLRPSC